MSSQQREATQTKAEPPTRQTELPMRLATGACAEAEGRGGRIESKEDSGMEQKKSAVSNMFEKYNWLYSRVANTIQKK